MINYSQIIKIKYPNARVYVEEGQNFEVSTIPDPAQMQSGTFDENGVFIPPSNSNVPMITVISQWDLPDPQPTIAELEVYAASPDYLAAWGARLKAERQVNDWTNQAVGR